MRMRVHGTPEMPHQKRARHGATRTLYGHAACNARLRVRCDMSNRYGKQGGLATDDGLWLGCADTLSSIASHRHEEPREAFRRATWSSVLGRLI